VVREAARQFCGILLTEGYQVYDRFAPTVKGLVHAQCWRHTRRHFVDAARAEPALVTEALNRIGKRSAQEASLPHQGFDAEATLAYRGEYTKPLVEAFFAWLTETLRTQPLLPSTPFAPAARYAVEREAALQVFLAYPNVPLDTNPLEREIRALALGRKNWLFCWTEVGAPYVGIAQSLIASCRLQGVAPYVYLVDVLQRVDPHPACDVQLLTPRLWKPHFAAHPLRSDLDRVRQ
jgi:transposase